MCQIYIHMNGWTQGLPAEHCTEHLVEPGKPSSAPRSSSMCCFFFFHCLV